MSRSESTRRGVKAVLWALPGGLLWLFQELAKKLAEDRLTGWGNHQLDEFAVPYFTPIVAWLWSHPEWLMLAFPLLYLAWTNRRLQRQDGPKVEAERTTPRFVLRCDDIGSPTSEVSLSVRNDGEPAKVRAYARLVSVNVDRDANKPTTREYELGWLGKPGAAVVVLGRGESATLSLADCGQADIHDDGPMKWFTLRSAGVGTDPTTEDAVVNSWLWNTVENEDPTRVVLAVRLVSDPPTAESHEHRFTIATRPGYGNIVLEACEPV